MVAILSVLVLVGLIQLLVQSESPMLCAILYTIVKCILTLAVGHTVLWTLLSGAIGFALAFAYFWLLNRIGAGSSTWWFVLIVGLLIGLV